MKQITFTELKTLIKHNVQFDVSNVKPITKFDQIVWVKNNAPQIIDKCDFSKLDGDDWSYLLQAQPQFADKCDFSKLSGNDWSYLLKKQPQLTKYMK